MYAPQAGHRISEYVLVECVGSGSFGQVWKAQHHIWSDQWVAIKVPTDSQYVRNLQKEGATVHGLRHPNIVRAIGLDPYADPPYFVMEFVDGVSLKQLIERHPKGMTPDVARELLIGILRALDHAHNNGVIHRDIKPANILISSGADRSLDTLSADDVKITDFGLGRAETITANSIMQSGSMLSEAGKSISGTLAYMAPEQRDGEEADARSDLYSVGIVLFEMLTGERPSGGDMPRQLRPDLPSWTDTVFSRLYTRRDRRFASARDVLDAVSQSGQPPVVAAYAGAMRSDRAFGPAAAGRRCSSCGGAILPDDNFCTTCGQQLAKHPRRCSACGAYPDPDDRFCIFCGTPVEARVA
ncbi:MAG: protein kinase [Phycisphaerae bacterium]|nr:serine/threonine-protein kinase [Phycisphaerae bacterium]NUQ44856.1 protein kinase [Phycisphaerae bacterium]